PLCPLWVIHDRCGRSHASTYVRFCAKADKRAGRLGTSALCQEPAHASQQTALHSASSPDEPKARSRASSTRYGEIRDITLECSSGYGRCEAQSGRCHVAASPPCSDLWTRLGGQNPDIASLIRATLTCP